MKRRALIIRSGYQPPAGAHNAAECMAQVLARRFEVVRCEGDAATRAGILAAYDDLIETAGADDAFAIYYAGHGGLASNASYVPGADLPRYVQHICPTDFDQTRDDDFRGISAFELAQRLTRLSTRAPNTTVMLDCCFSAQMTRRETPLAMPVLTRVGLARHLEDARAVAGVEAINTSRAVRIVASGQTELARQVSLPSPAALRALGLTSSRHDEWIGALTLGLIEVLADVGEARMPWRSIASALQARLLVQRPEIEGPVDRLPFSLETVESAGFAVTADGACGVMAAGQLHGVSIGDVYRVVRGEASIAQLTIEQVSATSARGTLVWSVGERMVPPDAMAIVVSCALARAPVRVSEPDAVRAVMASPRLRVAAAREPAIGELRIDGAWLELRDALGPLFPRAGFPDRLADAVRDLENLATERWLRALPEDGGIAPSAVTVELGRLAPGEAFRPIAPCGEPVGLGDELALRLENTTDAPLYANVFEIGLQRQISLVSEAWTSGVPLPPRKAVYVADVAGGELAGYGLEWPVGLPRDQPRRNAILAMITDAPIDLRVLETRSCLTPRQAAGSPLADQLAQLARGSRRSGRTPERHAVVWRDVLLYPFDASLEIGAPQVDASPMGSVASSGRLRVRCEAITCAQRLDLLVCTSSARLFTWDGSADVDLGAVDGTVDIYAWTSTGDGSLATLLDAPSLQYALAALRGDLAAGASLAIASAVRHALWRQDAGVVTAFRGSFTARDLGSVRYRAGAVEFTFVVEA